MPFLLLFVLFSSGITYAADEKWPGVDEAVVGKYAEEHGRPAKPSFIELEGDTLLFAFLVAGAAGGFVLGYYYRELISRPCAGRNTDAG